MNSMKINLKSTKWIAMAMSFFVLISMSSSAFALNKVKPNVVIGGGHPYWYDGGNDRYMPQDLYDKFVGGDYGAEYVFVERQKNVDGEVTYSSNSHTNELVRLYAKGQMAQLFKQMEGEWCPCTRIIDNTQIFEAMMIAAGHPMDSPLTVFPDVSACAE
jgi:alkaline phosphatase